MAARGSGGEGGSDELRTSGDLSDEHRRQFIRNSDVNNRKKLFRIEHVHISGYKVPVVYSRINKSNVKTRGVKQPLKESLVIADGVPHYRRHTPESRVPNPLLSIIGIHDGGECTEGKNLCLSSPGEDLGVRVQPDETHHQMSQADSPRISPNTSSRLPPTPPPTNKSAVMLGSTPGSPSKRGAMSLCMVYGTKEECDRLGGCGLRLVPTKQIINEWSNQNRMDKDGTLEISFDEWRDYLLFHPSANLQDIIQYWRHATNLDIGEDLSVPDDFSPEEWLSGNWWRHLVAGGVAGMVSRTCTAPLDRLKVFLQVHGAGKFQSLKDCFSYMLKEGGVKSLWRGNGINVLKIAPESAIKFAAYEQAKKFVLNNFGEPTRELRVSERFIAGSFAGAFSQTVIYPMEVLKTRLALRKTGQFNGIVDAAKKIYAAEGFKPFYRGYAPNLMGIIPYAGIDLAVYETLKKRFARSGDKESSVFVIIGCGALSSSCGQVASYPLALIRTRLQAQVRTVAADPLSGTATIISQPTTTIGLFRHILEKEGVRGLYRGIAPNFLKVAPAVSISYVMYEKCRDYLGVKMT